MIASKLNTWVFKYIKIIEMLGVLMRIFSFSLVSWFGPETPFMFVWIFNTIDAVFLSWCSVLKKDNAYIVLNSFWILVGLIGIAKSCHCLPEQGYSEWLSMINQVKALYR